MAISQFPGVGPTNTDVANAVVTAGTSAGFAATGPTTTQIAAAVPTLAQITTAITSNAASAGVTMAAITSSITANAASAGVTLAAIGTQVASNSSPFGGTWTNIYANTTSVGVGTLTVSGLGSYKYLRIRWFGLGAGADGTFRVRFNGDTTNNNYVYYTAHLLGSSYNTYTNRSNGDSWFQLGPITQQLQGYGAFEIMGSNASGMKALNGLRTYFQDPSGIWSPLNDGMAVWRSTAAITSISFINQTGASAFETTSRFIIDGAN